MPLFAEGLPAASVSLIRNFDLLNKKRDREFENIMSHRQITD